MILSRDGVRPQPGRVRRPTPVGTAGAYSFPLSVPGPGTAARGRGDLGISAADLPAARRAAQHDAPPAGRRARAAASRWPCLWASEAVIYSRYGYGRAMWHADLTLRRGEGTLARAWSRLTRPAPAAGRTGGGADRAGQGLRRRAAVAPGPDRAERSLVAADVHDPADSRQGATPLHCLLAEDDSGPRGYALYRGQPDWDRETSLPDAVLTVRELVATDPAASAAMWTDLLSRDLTSGVPRPGPPGGRPAAVPAERSAPGPGAAEGRAVGADHGRAWRAGRAAVLQRGGRGDRGAGRAAAGECRAVAAGHVGPGAARTGMGRRASLLVRPRLTWSSR